MSGTMKGSLMKKLGMKGKTKPGEMISQMNKMKNAKNTPVKKTAKVALKKTIKKII